MNREENKKNVSFSRILQNIKDELEEGNPKFTKIVHEVLMNDGSLALKAKFGQSVEIRFLPDDEVK